MFGIILARGSKVRDAFLSFLFTYLWKFNLSSITTLSHLMVVFSTIFRLLIKTASVLSAASRNTARSSHVAMLYLYLYHSFRYYDFRNVVLKTCTCRLIHQL